MSFSCVTNYFAENFSQILESFKNGEVRFLAMSAESYDSGGFPTTTRAPRTTEFIGCLWEPVVSVQGDGQDALIARRVTTEAVYKITVPQIIDGVSVVVKPSDQVELRCRLGAVEIIQLEIIGRHNQNNASWLIYAVQTDSENES